MISVVIPARDAASSVAFVLRSLIPDCGLIREILLVDDGSRDATAEIANDAAQRHGLPLRVLPVTFGNAGAARNHGMAEARGRFLFFIDVDDELVPGALTVLAAKLEGNPEAGLAVGSCIRQTANRPDKIKVPQGYTKDCRQNAIRYLANELWPIAMGSAMLVAAQTADIRFPEAIDLDEDTCFWAALLARVQVVTTTAPVLFYKLDEDRMARRYATMPCKTLLKISRAFRALAKHGVPETALRQRVAWVALRIARQLIINRRYAEAGRILRLTRAHPRYRLAWDVFRYDCRIEIGSFCQRHGLCLPLVVRHKPDDLKERRRILIVTVDDASLPVSGADLRNHQNTLSAAKAGLVRAVSIRPSEREMSGHQLETEFTSVGVSGDRSKALSSWRCSVEARISYACLARLLKIIGDFCPDTIIVEGIPLVALFKHLRPLAGLLILDMHNIESNLAVQKRARPAGEFRFADFFNNDAARIRGLERRALKFVDQVWVCSEQDRKRLLELHRPAVPVQVVPNSIPRFELLQNERRSEIREGEREPVLLFVGHLGYWPNVVAAERLVRGVLPIVREAFPGARVILAGRYPQPAVESLSVLAGVELHANPESLAEFYQRADMAVVPLAEGGGTRIKILEAMAAGLPVVATSVAVEGLGLIESEEVLVADSDEGLACHIIDLWRNPEAKLRQSRFAERTAKLRFSPEAVDWAVKKSISGD
ncbi:MAG TPA: glycosyltransferase [Verrucomicrobiae bacterium]|nr:glycosyltransferase [Verrucomicrobiae bacterium]